jgi:hypothetical protein
MPEALVDIHPPKVENSNESYKSKSELRSSVKIKGIAYWFMSTAYPIVL